MVLKRGLLLAIFIALLVIFIQFGNNQNAKKAQKSALITFYNATTYNIGEDYLRIKAKKILRFKQEDKFDIIEVDFLNLKNETYFIQANRAVIKDEIIMLFDNVVCKLTDGSVLYTQQLVYNPKSHFIHNSKKFKIEYKSHTLKGNNLALNVDDNSFKALNTKFVLKIQ